MAQFLNFVLLQISEIYAETSAVAHNEPSQTLLSVW